MMAAVCVIGSACAALALCVITTSSVCAPAGAPVGQSHDLTLCVAQGVFYPTMVVQTTAACTVANTSLCAQGGWYSNARIISLVKKNAILGEKGLDRMSPIW